MRLKSRWLAAVALLVMSSACLAMPVRWHKENFRYTADGKPLKDVLKDFAASQGMAVSVASDVEGAIAGKFDLLPSQFIDLLARSYGFVYYYNGALLSISSAKDMRSTLVRLDYAKVAQLKEVLARMGVLEARFPVVYDETANTALVAGPPEYISVIREMAAHLERRMERSGRDEIRRYPLNYAWASDRKSAGEELPGVVSVLQRLYGSNAKRESNGAAGAGSQAQAAQDRVVQGASVQTDRVAPALMGNSQNGSSSRVSAAAGGRDGSGFIPDAPPGPGAKAAQGAYNENLPVIVADVASNTVVIRDLPERFPAYEAVIAALDTRPRMIEIGVHIIDIDENALTDLGVNWSASSSRISGSLGSVDSASPTSGSQAGVLTAVVGNSGRQLLARITALEQDGRASVSARPKVAALNNSPALMSSQKTFYVKVGGYQSSQLFSVSAGMNLKVTPMAVLGPDGFRIRLDIHIEDGQVSSTDSVEGIPLVTKSEIETQAIVGESQSLLMAGYATERDGVRTSKVPWLSEIPLVGALFRSTKSDRSRSERLVMLSPRVLD